MRLQRLLSRLQRHPAFQSVLAHAGKPGAAVLSAITPARPFAVAALHAAVQRPMLLVVARPTDARGYVSELIAWAEDPEAVLLFPETDALPYDRLPNDADKLADRLAAMQRLAGLAGGPPALVVASTRAAMDLLVDPATFRGAHRTIRRGDTLPPGALATEWLRLGYEPSPVVDQPGLFSRRGGILDVFPPGGFPLRIELWGDAVDTIRAFDPATQPSTEPPDEAQVGPRHEGLPQALPPTVRLEALRPHCA